MKYEGKKLLIVGGVPMLSELIAYAQENGAHVIVADNVRNSLTKKMADEAWDISTADISILAEECRENHVDGLAAGFNDFNIGKAAELAEATGLRFYATPELADMTMDKTRFNTLCREYGVPTMRRFDEGDDPETFQYPVIVKPVDSSGNRGITICMTPADVPAALDYARSNSYKGNILVEEYVDGDEVVAGYFAQNGVVRCSAMHDRYLQLDNGKAARLPLVYIYPSKYAASFMENEDELVRSMFQEIGVKDGTIFIQGCVSENVVKFFEMGYRISGAKSYQIIEAVHGVNPMKCLVDHTLLGTMGERGDVEKMNPLYPEHYATVVVSLNAGIIAKIGGVDDIQSHKGYVSYSPYYVEGDEIKQEFIGTQKQVFGRITMKASSLNEIIECVDFVNEHFAVVDNFGKDMIVERFDTRRISE